MGHDVGFKAVEIQFVEGKGHHFAELFGYQSPALVLAINVLGDWLRDALNPRLR